MSPPASVRSGDDNGSTLNMKIIGFPYFCILPSYFSNFCSFMNFVKNDLLNVYPIK